MSRKSYANIEVSIRLTLLPGEKADKAINWIREQLKSPSIPKPYNAESLTVRMTKKEIVYP